MQNIKFIDNQWVTLHVVQMWFKPFGIYFHVAGNKTDLESLSWEPRKQFRQILLLFDNSVILERRT